MTFDDFQPAPNIRRDPGLYEVENRAIAHDGRLDAALRRVADWTGRDLLDIGSGTGFWLHRYGLAAASVVGVEPDDDLRAVAADRDLAPHVRSVAGSAEHLPLDDDSVDVAHARFAYFWGEGCEPGLAEVARVLRPGGRLGVVDNDWSWGEFAALLALATDGNGTIDPDARDAWWHEQGARRIRVQAGWRAKDPAELETILRLEFTDDVVDRFLADREPSATITYGVSLFAWTP